MLCEERIRDWVQGSGSGSGLGLGVGVEVGVGVCSCGVRSPLTKRFVYQLRAGL